MNRQQLADERSRAFHLKIIEKLQQHPELWRVPEQNLQRWETQMDGLSPALYEWSRILHSCSKEEIVALLQSSSEEADRLRSSSPFTGILSQKERENILSTFTKKQAQD